MFERRGHLLGIFSALVLISASCSAPPLDGSSALSKRAVFEATSNAITKGDCFTALQTIQPLYESANSDNEVRMMMASAYACHANVRLITMALNLGSNSSRLVGGDFWGLMAELFPSTTADRVPESGALASDALMAATIPGWPLVPSMLFNMSTYNVGSLLPGDRVADSNFFLIFTSMATIGGLNSRFGAPDSGSNYDQTTRLPWQTAAAMDADGCMYASAVLNMIDALSATSGNVTGTLSTSLLAISDTFSAGIEGACDIGCQNLDPDAGGSWQASGCTTTTACSSCPQSLRNRDTCLAATDQTKCAAAGIINFINDSPMLGAIEVAWPGP
jgi:hypothetical protein